MDLLIAVLVIVFEAVGEAVTKKYLPKVSDVVFKWWLQWIIAAVLFLIWFFIVLNIDESYIPAWKLICGFVFVRFMIFDIIYNLTFGLRWNYYGTTKMYDLVMSTLVSWGWFLKLVLGIVGIVFLMGWS